MKPVTLRITAFVCSSCDGRRGPAAAEVRVVPRVVPDLVAVGEDLADDPAIRRDLLSEHEERRRDRQAVERGEELRRDRADGPSS